MCRITLTCLNAQKLRAINLCSVFTYYGGSDVMLDTISSNLRQLFFSAMMCGQLCEMFVYGRPML